MGQKIDIRCTECGHEARVPDAFKGKKVRCLRCRAKLRVPGVEGPASGPVVTLDAPTRARTSRGSRETREREGGRSRERRETPGELSATAGAGGLSSKTRREAQQAIREILGDYEHAIEESPRGFEIDLRGVAFGLARTLVEDLLAANGVRDVKLAGGTGECRMTVTLEGAVYDPDDSFADGDDETEIFRRPNAAGNTPVDEASEPPRATPSRGSGERPARPEPRKEPSRREEKSPPGASELDALVEEGLALLEAGEARDAIAVLERAVKIERDNVAAVEALGHAYARAGDRERARRAFRHLTKLVPDDAEAAIFHAAEAVACDRLEDAREALAAAIKLDPENPKAYRYAAVLYERLGDPDRAKKFRAKYESLKR
jgi:tetratricopeptide (TPR) repeat protein